MALDSVWLKHVIPPAPTPAKEVEQPELTPNMFLSWFGQGQVE